MILILMMLLLFFTWYLNVLKDIKFAKDMERKYEGNYNSY